MFRSVFLAISGLCLLGCSIHAPIVRYQASSVTSSTPEAIGIELEFEIANTNNELIKLIEYQYDVFAHGQHLYSGKQMALQSIPRWSTMQGTIPVVIRRSDLNGQQILDWNMTGSLRYNERGAFAETLLNSGLWKPSSQVYAHGVLEIPQ